MAVNFGVRLNNQNIQHQLKGVIRI